MRSYKEKMIEFVDRLWSNPAIRSATLLKKENQILSFIKENTEQLQTAMGQPHLFPDLSWDDILRLLFTELTERVVRTMEPKVESVVHRVARKEILDAFAGGDGPDALSPLRFKDYIMSVIRSKPVRDQYMAVLEAISSRFYERYVPVVLERRKVIYYEIIRRDRLELEEILIPDYLSLVSLFRPLFYVRVESAGHDSLCLADAVKNRKFYSNIMQGLEDLLTEKTGHIPKEILMPGLESCLNAQENTEVSGSSRLINILVSRAAEFDPGQHHDRGAESPDKSWFNINRRTYKYYGYDSRFLEELYQIASEEGW